MDDTVKEHVRGVEAGGVRLMTALARMAGDPVKYRPTAEKALRSLEALAERDGGKTRADRDEILIATLPGVRALRGNGPAAKRWKETERAPHPLRRQLAFEAGLALAGAGDAAGAEQAYRLAMTPDGIERNAFTSIAARVKLAELLRGQKRDAEAAALEAEVDRVWANADAGIRDKIQILR